MGPIKLFWWRPNDPEKPINIGDEIGPILVEHVSGRKVVRAPLRRCELISVGSILSFGLRQNVFAQRSEPIHVWGSGIIEPVAVPREANYIYASVRGPLTRCLVPAPMDLPLGDPGLLASLRFPSSGTKEFSWGIVPHHTQLKAPAIQRLLENTKSSVLIDVTNPDIKGTLELFGKCERIVSSSLHGLIFADSYGVPNGWISPKAIDTGWKFIDYLASVGRTRFEPLKLAKRSNLAKIGDDELETGHLDSVPRHQQKILDAFPSEFRV